MKITANIATQKHRIASLMRTVDSIAPQVDELRIYYTGCNCDLDWLSKYPNAKAYKGEDKGSNAKFHFVKPNEYYFTCDDDIIYPPDYVKKTLEKLKMYGGYVTYHGRLLRGPGLSYYTGHRTYHCLKGYPEDVVIDVPGTGVGCFNSNEFTPENIEQYGWKNMDDVAIGYECARQRVKVTMLAHDAGWIKEVPMKQKTSIYRTEKRNQSRQIELSDKIWDMRNPKPKVSIIIPYKEDRGWLKDAIKSVHNQIYDGEIELILSQSNNNAAYNFNRGFEASTGDYVRFLCDDDILPPFSISDSVEAIKGHLACHGNAETFWPDGGTRIHRAEPVTFEGLMQRNSIHGGTVLYDRKCFEKYGLLDETLTTGEEFEFNLRILSNGVTFGVCNNIVYRYRRHDKQKSLGRGVDMAARTKQIKGFKEIYRNELRSRNIRLQSA